MVRGWCLKGGRGRERKGRGGGGGEKQQWCRGGAKESANFLRVFAKHLCTAQQLHHGWRVMTHVLVVVGA